MNRDKRFTHSMEATRDDGPNWTTKWGIAGVPATVSDVHTTPADVTSVPDTHGGNAGYLVLDVVILSFKTACDVTLQEETSGTVIAGPYTVLANTTYQFQYASDGSQGKKLPTAGKKLQVKTSVASVGTIDVGYHSSDFSPQG